MNNQNIKLAVPSSPPGGLNARVNSRFGRCEFFTIIQIEQNKIQEVVIIPNAGINAMGGAGLVAAQTIANEGVKIVLGGDYGPNAITALVQGGIKVYGYPMNSRNLMVKTVVESFLKGELAVITNASVPSHTGMR